MVDVNRWTLLAASLALAWAATYAPLVGWTLAGWSRGDGPVQAILAVVALVSVVRGVDPAALAGRLARAPHASPALALALGAPVLGALAWRAFPLDVVLAAAAVASGAGLVGLYAPPDRWRASWPAAALAGLLLPVTDHLDVIVGWPLRKLVAAAAAQLLGPLGPTLAVETVLQVEGGVAHVDLPCAGVRSLWALTAVLLTATALRGRRVDLRWALGAGAAAGVLVVANVLRVATIVGLTHHLGWTVLADVVHQPLGAIGFAAACAVGLAGLRWEGPAPAPGPEPRPAPLLGALALPALAVAAWLATAASTAAPAPTPPLPAGATALAPSVAEAAFAAEHGASLVKARVDGGTVVLVAARSWVAHHVPVACLEAAGWALSADHPAAVDGQPLRVAAATRDGRAATAIWWLQSHDTTTDDHVVRIRDGLVSDRPWVLVSVLLDGAPPLSDPDVQALVRELRASVTATLEDS